MRDIFDVVIVGGGPAGSAAAIHAASAGLKVQLLERAPFPRHRPGETLHPGVEPILRQLGVLDRAVAASPVRHAAISVDWGGRRSRNELGPDGSGKWRGLQVRREDLDALLLEQARVSGAAVVQPAPANAPYVRNGRVAGVRSGRHPVSSSFVIDATGGTGWLQRHLRLLQESKSPPLRAHYGYCEGSIAELTDAPALTGDASGWTWVAQVAPRMLNWTRVDFRPQGAATPPPAVASLQAIGRLHHADVTWRRVPAAAGPGYFIAGDAAMIVDPAGSHGVLRALMSGIMASHAVIRVLLHRAPEKTISSEYCAWLAQWFHHDTRELSALYRELNPRWNARSE